MNRRVAGLGHWAAGFVVVALSGGLSAGATAAPVQSASAVGSPPVAAAPAYVDPPPVRVYRFHVYATMKQRRTKKVVIESLVSTSGSSSVKVGDKALLERSVDVSETGAAGWVPVASVTVTKISAKGRIEVQIESEEPEAAMKRKGRTPFSAGQKVRMQIDRLMSAE